ncbi:hypothetical protein LN042_19010 [Kitasatospora sp. RB6PN24]|uniref:hypothetical protein n=1 Tax=Kitasatospora humi TaxID=2893891 RepID=UPI001E467397|nr:hypothetical protein [Kitasatospora humi]MCC9309147.1 hypothetical protein [Kitasatospora humi]
MTDLIVTPDDVAVRLGYPTPLSDAVRQRVETAIVDAQDALESHLGRPLTPAEYTELGVHPDSSGSGWVLKHTPVRLVLSATLDPNPGPASLRESSYTVKYLGGIDARTDPDTAPLRLWLRATACAHPLLSDAPARQRRVASASVEGQSVTYDTGTDAPALLAPPALATVDRWRVRGRRAYQAPVRPAPPGLMVPGIPGTGGL